MPWPLTDLADPTIDTPPLSPSSATRSSVASSSSSLSSGELSSRSSRKFPHDSIIFDGAREDDIMEELDANMECDNHSFDRGGTDHELPRGQHERTSRLRPQMPRQNSHSKRHSSFDTPREVPFPYGYLALSLSDHSNKSGDPRYGRANGVSLNSPGESSHLPDETTTSGNYPLVHTESGDGGANGESASHRPNFELSSTASLPLLTSTPYSTFPSISSSKSLLRSDCAWAPGLPVSSTRPGFPSPLGFQPRATSSGPSAKKADPSELPPLSHPNQCSLSPDSPPFILDEPDTNEQGRSTRPPSYFSSPSYGPDNRPHHSFPPPPKIFSSISSTSFPTFRTISLPHSNENARPSHPLSGTSLLPPPEPPTILTPPPPLSDAEAKARKPAPYEPFLPRGQPPPDHTYIAVETVPEEYRLIVRLPGFQRDSITLAMRRRRILHVVADNWSDGGGHFERRISFGYDADLANVRAEFDGEVLRIIVPRRDLPGWYTQPTI